MQNDVPDEGVTAPEIHRVTTLDLSFEPAHWSFAEERRDDIARYFDAAQAKRPLWNGRVLLARNPLLGDGRFAASYFETDFASFLAWRDWGFPDKTVFNAPGSGALRGSDGAFALGVMGEHTANAGRIYFPAGTPEPDDLRGLEVDIAGSVTREVEEETGLAAADYRAAEHWHCVASGQMIGIVRILDVDMPGEALRAKIEANLGKQASPELSGIHLVRSAADITPAMPLFVTAFLRAHLPS